VLGEFTKARIGTGPNALKWNKVRLRPSLPSDALPAGDPEQGLDRKTKTKDELDELIALIEYRPAVMAEAMAQRNGMLAYWRGVLSLTRGSHPKTYRLMQVAVAIGSFQAQHYKRKFMRARPSHLCPLLMPPIDPPGHPAFPSGHATQSWLLVSCLEKVLPIQAHTALGKLAERVARNREVLGLHYPSDSKAGEELARQTFKLMDATPPIKVLISAAKAEWA